MVFRIKAMRLLIAPTVACLAAMLVPISARGGSNLAFDNSGNLFFVAPNSNTILKFAPDGTKSTWATGIQGDLAFDAAGNLFVGVADATGTIYKFSPEGTKSTFASGVGVPFNLALDPAGNLFVFDLVTGSILKFSPTGNKSTFKEGKKPHGQMFANSMTLACDRAGNLFAMDEQSGTILKFAPDGTRSTFATKVKATGLAFDPTGNLFAVNFWSNTIAKFAPDGTRSTLKTKLSAPEGLAVDATGNLFVYDNPERKIVRLTADGTASSFADNKPEAAAAEKPRSNQEREAAGEDSSAGLPEQYAKNYLTASKTVSPDKKFAVIYPNEAMGDAASAKGTEIKDYLVTLLPFAVLQPLDTKWPYYEHESHGGLGAEWSDDSSVALITLDGKWGPHDIFLVEFRDGKLSRMTNILAKAHDLLLPDYRKAKPERYNEYFDFIFESEDEPICKLDGVKQVRIEGHATTDPKGLSRRKWSAQVKAVWDIPKAKFIEQKITRSRAKESD